MKNCAIIFYIVLIVILTSCSKKTEVSGYVYSKYGSPVANGTVIISESKSGVGRAPTDDKNIATTDNDGYFQFKFRWKYKKTYSVKCKSDSGLALGGTIKKMKTNMIILDTY